MTILGVSLTLIIVAVASFTAGVILRSVVRSWIEAKKKRFLGR